LAFVRKETLKREIRMAEKRCRIRVIADALQDELEWLKDEQTSYNLAQKIDYELQQWEESEISKGTSPL
jgi:hypothetical protein